MEQTKAILAAPPQFLRRAVHVENGSTSWEITDPSLQALLMTTHYQVGDADSGSSEQTIPEMSPNVGERGSSAGSLVCP
jgi:hypothetical protein